MSAKQVVSPARNQTAFVIMLHDVLNHRPPSVLQYYSIKITKTSSQCVVNLNKPSVLVLIPRIVFLQSMASEGSEERGVHTFMHWLIGELWV